MLNGEAIKNSEDYLYALDSSEYRTLCLYEKDYNGVIPSDAYLILGNFPQGSCDSTQIGLVDVGVRKTVAPM